MRTAAEDPVVAPPAEPESVPASPEVPSGAPPRAQVAQTLAYDQSPNHVTKRQFSLLLLLVFLHLVLFAAFVCLPAVSPAVKQGWADWQARRAAQKTAVAAQAKLQAVLHFSRPPTTLLYAEAPDDVRKLLTSVGRTQTLAAVPYQEDERGNRYMEADFINELRAAKWEPPAMVTRDDALTAWLVTAGTSKQGMVPGNAATIFMHGVKTPAGKDRLVCVSFEATQVTQHRDSGSVKPRTIETKRNFRAAVVNHLDSNSRPVITTLQINDPPEGRTVLWVQTPPAQVGTRARANLADATPKMPVVQMQRGRMWRVFAGQAHPTDPTRFSIPIEIDGKAMTIEGQLNDGDRVMLTPSSGEMVAWVSASAYMWDLGLGPMTRPATLPATRRENAGTAGAAGASNGP